MGWIGDVLKKVSSGVSTIGEAIKTSYNSADSTLGGYLPGGSTQPGVTAPTAPQQPSETLIKQPGTNFATNSTDIQQVQKPLDTTPATDYNGIPANKVTDIARALNMSEKDVIGLAMQGNAQGLINSYTQATGDNITPAARGGVMGAIDSYFNIGAPKPGEPMVLNSAGAVLGGATVGGLATKLGASITPTASKTLVSTIGKVGTTGLPDWATLEGGILLKATSGYPLNQIPINTVTKAQSASIISKILTGVKNNPLATAVSVTAATGIILDMIGTINFTGFLKEEALQTLDFGVKQAHSTNDKEGMRAALDQQKAILNPDVWTKIKEYIPYLNVQEQVDNFVAAAKTKYAINEKLYEDMVNPALAGETPEAKWSRVDQEESASQKERTDYYNSERKAQLQFEATLKNQQRQADLDLAREKQLIYQENLQYEAELKQMENEFKTQQSKLYSDNIKLQMQADREKASQYAENLRLEQQYKYLDYQFQLDMKRQQMEMKQEENRMYEESRARQIMFESEMKIRTQQLLEQMKQNQASREEQERKSIANFWYQYRIKILDLQKSQSASNLSFKFL